MQKNILVIGQGEIGSAITALLRTKQIRTIDCWDSDPKRCPTRKKLDEMVPRADIIFLCVPSWCLRAVSDVLRPLLSPRTILVALSKGLDKHTHSTVAELLYKEFLDTRPVVLLSGPMLAEEILAGKQAACVVASSHTNAIKTIQELFRGTALRTTPSYDVKGASLCSVLKNIYAIGMGIAAAKNAGNNFKGWYVQEAAAEMATILSRAGGRPETAYGPAGLGDLIATGASAHSANFSYGYALAKGKKPKKKAEGAESLPSVLHLTRRLHKRLPLLVLVSAIVQGTKKPSTLVE